MSALEQFKGYVEEVSDGRVYAVMTDEGGITERVEFPLARFPENERQGVRDGTIFSMSVFADRVRLRCSQRHVSAKAIAQAKHEGDKLFRMLNGITSSKAQ